MSQIWCQNPPNHDLKKKNKKIPELDKINKNYMLSMGSKGKKSYRKNGGEEAGHKKNLISIINDSTQRKNHSIEILPSINKVQTMDIKEDLKPENYNYSPKSADSLQQWSSISDASNKRLSLNILEYTMLNETMHDGLKEAIK